MSLPLEVFLTATDLDDLLDARQALDEIDVETFSDYLRSPPEDAVRSLEAAGGMVASRPQRSEWGYRAVVRDPDGRAVELCQV